MQYTKKIKPKGPLESTCLMLILLLTQTTKATIGIHPLIWTLSLPVNVAYICVHEIVVHMIKFIQWYTTAMQEENKSETISSISDQKSANINQLKVTVQSNHLSESNTKCWLSGSFRACAKSLFSASTIEIFPHIT